MSFIKHMLKFEERAKRRFQNSYSTFQVKLIAWLTNCVEQRGGVHAFCLPHSLRGAFSSFRPEIGTVRVLSFSQ
jgi:hypothetical protein